MEVQCWLTSCADQRVYCCLTLKLVNEATPPSCQKQNACYGTETGIYSIIQTYVHIATHDENIGGCGVGRGGMLSNLAEKIVFVWWGSDGVTLPNASTDALSVHKFIRRGGGRNLAFGGGGA